MFLMPQSHLLYAEDTAAVGPRNREIPAAAAEDHPTAYPYLLQVVGVAVGL